MKIGIRMMLSLVVICIVAAASLAAVYVVTDPRIQEQVRLALMESLNKTFPQASTFEPVLEDTVWSARDEDGAELGIVIKVAPRGYGGKIETLVGVGLDEKITGVKTATPVEGLKETPGLGVKVNDDWFQNQFVGRTGTELILRKDNPSKGTIDAITAATISSRAVTRGVKEGVEKYSEFLKRPEGS